MFFLRLPHCSQVRFRDQSAWLIMFLLPGLPPLPTTAKSFRIIGRYIDRPDTTISVLVIDGAPQRKTLSVKVRDGKSEIVDNIFSPTRFYIDEGKYHEV